MKFIFSKRRITFNNLFSEWSLASSPENYKSILGLLKENNLQPHIFDFQAELCDLAKNYSIGLKVIFGFSEWASSLYGRSEKDLME